MPRRYTGLGPSHVRTGIPSTRRLDQWVSLRKILRFRVRLRLGGCLEGLDACCLLSSPADVTSALANFLEDIYYY